MTRQINLLRDDLLPGYGKMQLSGSLHAACGRLLPFGAQVAATLCGLLVNLPMAPFPWLPLHVVNPSLSVDCCPPAVALHFLHKVLLQPLQLRCGTAA